MKDVKAIIAQIQAGDDALKNQFVQENLPLVWSIVHRFKNGSYDKEDLFQVGSIGLVKAINKFDASYNTQFSTYAVPIIIGEIKRFFRDEGSIKVSRKLKENYLKIQKVRNQLQENGTEPSIQEIADYLQMDVQEVIESLEISYHPLSLSDPIYEKDGSSISLEDSIADDNYDKFINLIQLKDELAKLSPKERLLIELRYYHELNQQDIAKRFNVSQVQISRMEKKIIEKLRRQFINL